jgi:enoyl-CoA hydratase
MYDNYKSLLIDRSDHILTITLNEPPMNPIGDQLEEELSQIFVDVNRDTDIRVVVLTGAGKAFSAGGNLDWVIDAIESNDFDGWVTSMRRVRRTLMSMLDLDAPIIAKINGHAIGLGATIAFFSDITVAAEHATFADPHVQIGLVAGDGGSQIWPQLIGYARAKRYLLTGDAIKATEAASIGLISEVVSADKLDEAVDNLAERIAKLPPRGVRGTKRAINIPLLRDIVQSIDANLGLETFARLSDEHGDAVRALRDKIGRKS